MRNVWPTSFQLFWAQLVEASRIGLARKVRDLFFKKNDDSSPLPIALRWSASPQLAFARQPFEVWRRLRKPVAKQVLAGGPLQVNGTLFVNWLLVAQDLMYEVLYDATPNGSLTVEALDTALRVIPGQRITFTAAAKGRFRAPGIWMLRATGSGTIANVRGIDETTYANLPDWQRIETVGFPYKKNEVAAPVYTPNPQGFEAPALTGFEAAKIRLEILRLLTLPAPPSGIPDFPAPLWPPPDIAKYLDALRDPNPSQLNLITECLKNSDDANLGLLQAKFRADMQLDGISQGNIPNAQPDPAKPSQASVPVVAATMLSITGDSYVSTGLGYGTIDMPLMNQGAAALQHLDDPDRGRSEPGGGQQIYDYMVTNHHVLPWGVKVELAALCQQRPPAAKPAQAATTLKQIHRPAKRDWQALAAVRLNWNDPGYPQGYAIAVSRQPSVSQYLNTPRAGNSGGFDAYVALTPQLQDPNTPPDLQRPSFTDLRLNVPFTGSATARYLVAAVDVFGMWSGWTPVNFTVSALPANRPGLLSADFKLNAAAAVGNQVPADLTIEFGWDWDDRTPQAIRFDGAFFPIPSPVINDPWPPAGAVSGLQKTPGGAPTGTVVVTFTPQGEPQISSGHPGSVIRLNPGGETAIPDDNNNNITKQRRYRLILTGFTCDFGSTTKNGFCVYARGVEKVAPAAISPPIGPKIALAYNPLPPPISPLAVVNWAAMPDSTGRARALLKWTKDPSAKGYVVYEASEAQLRTLFTVSPADPAPGTSMVQRATLLQNQINAQPQKSLSAFVRLNMKLIEADKEEIDLPASATNIFAYQIAAVAESNVESERSSVSFWAVPRRMTPGTPSLLLRRTAGQIKVIALPGGGVTPAGYRVFRVHKPNLASDLGLMGPPKIDENSAGWQAHQEPQLHGGPAIQGKSIVDAAAAPSWFPYYYRIVALGPSDMAEGQFRGESEASTVQSILIPPIPSLAFISAQKGIKHIVFRFSSNMPLKKTPLGVARIEIFELNPDNPVTPTKFLRKSVLSVTTDQVPLGFPFVLNPMPTPAFLAGLPHIRHQAPNAQGVANYSVIMRAGAAKKTRIIRVTDPTARPVEVEFEV